MEQLHLVMRMALADTGSGYLREFIQDIRKLDADDQKYDAFCEEFGLGQWFYDALMRNEVDLVEELIKLLAEKR